MVLGYLDFRTLPSMYTIHVYIYIHTYIHIHTYTYIYTYVWDIQGPHLSTDRQVAAGHAQRPGDALFGATRAREFRCAMVKSWNLTGIIVVNSG